MAKHVLVVDDNPSDQMVAKAFLENGEMIVKVISNGIDALDYLGEEDSHPNLLVIDLQMPQMPGLQLLKRVRKLDKYQKIPILIMSARQDVKDVKLAIELGASDYCVKPLDGPVFLKKVKKLTQNIDESWAEYTLDEEFDDVACKIQQNAKLMSISETGMTLKSPFPLDPEELTNFEAQTFKEIGFDILPLTKVVSSQRKENYFILKLAFVGLPEKYGKMIRQYCRQKWSQKKQREELEPQKSEEFLKAEQAAKAGETANAEQTDSNENTGGQDEKSIDR
ncbi:MAG: hypothetical protein CL676_13960 [Bdellovibrionaceae bacterium]|nr:hypothetical protein [Pseudobdellovibrionaceae bacterium]|tara:strand:+ start:427 stop:1266 length:840 start_codon:yes stop_codon:yes gene_type:complete